MADWVLKLCLLGDAAVGKTSLLYRFIEGRFSTDFKETLGVNLLKKEVVVDEQSVTANIWDLGGQDAYRALRKLYLEGANGALLVFDVTNPASFRNLTDWLESFQQVRENRPVLLIGNKIDLSRQVAREQVEQFLTTRPEKITYLETSAKTGENVEQAFVALVRETIKFEEELA